MMLEPLTPPHTWRNTLASHQASNSVPGWPGITTLQGSQNMQTWAQGPKVKELSSSSHTQA